VTCLLLVLTTKSFFYQQTELLCMSSDGLLHQTVPSGTTNIQLLQVHMSGEHYHTSPLFKKDSFNLLTCFNNTKRTPSFTANYLQPGAVPRGVQPVPPTFVFSGPNTLATIRKRKRSGFYQHFVFLPSLAFCLLVSWYSHSSSIAKDGTLLQSATCMVHATLARG
jgi:hypothetical protein